jgi:hypothetical protein
LNISGPLVHDVHERFSAASVRWERATRKASRTKSNTTKDDVRKQCATARKTDERGMNAQDCMLQSVVLPDLDFASDEVFAEHNWEIAINLLARLAIKGDLPR